MNDLKPAGVVGQGFLWSEARLHPMHISGLWILRPPAGEEREWSHRLFESFSRYREAVPPFNPSTLARSDPRVLVRSDPPV
ncbi:MAG: hypothetical protein DIJKHBIC_03233 [Thermoanaerobaculia bacterium]|nr:hypothetical protein [Thermoanaerobaculia bacterium]